MKRLSTIVLGAALSVAVVVFSAFAQGGGGGAGVPEQAPVPAAAQEGSVAAPE
jgi:hypothetical protein